MTLTFDLVTLTSGQLYRLININHMCKYHQDPFISSRVKTKTRILHKCISDLDLWPCDLDLGTLGQLYRLIKINNIFEYNQDPSIGSWFIAETKNTWICIWLWPLTFWPWPLVNFNILSISIIYVSIIMIPSSVFMIYRRNKNFT